MKMRLFVSLVLVLSVSAAALGQDAPKPAMSAEEKAMMDSWMQFMTPGSGQKMLDPMVGTWDAKVSIWMAPTAPVQVSMGVSENRWVLGNRYMEQSFSGVAMGMPFNGIGYTGYDNAKKEYFGTWIDNMGTGIMTTTGNTADGGKSWSFTSHNTDPMTKKDSAGQMKITVAGADQHTMEMWSPAPDGTMFKTMEIVYNRKK